MLMVMQIRCWFKMLGSHGIIAIQSNQYAWENSARIPRFTMDCLDLISLSIHNNGVPEWFRPNSMFRSGRTWSDWYKSTEPSARHDSLWKKVWFDRSGAERSCYQWTIAPASSINSQLQLLAPISVNCKTIVHWYPSCLLLRVCSTNPLWLVLSEPETQWLGVVVCPPGHIRRFDSWVDAKPSMIALVWVWDPVIRCGGLPTG